MLASHISKLVKFIIQLRLPPEKLQEIPLLVLKARGYMLRIGAVR